MVTSLGGEKDDYQQGIFNYTITIANNSSEVKTITGVEPVLSEELSNRLSGSTYQIVRIRIEPQAHDTVSGTLRFDFEGLSKGEIMAMEPFLTGFLINEDFVAVP
jgi:hypothetical protein